MCLTCRTQTVQVRDPRYGKHCYIPVTMSLDVPARGWRINNKGYVCYNSSSKSSGVRRFEFLHRHTMYRLLWQTPWERRVGPAFHPRYGIHGELLGSSTNWVVHHMDGDKANNAPSNLIWMPHYFNPTGARRHPYTGAFMSAEAYRRLLR